MNAEELARNFLDEVPYLVQPEKRLITMSNAILVAIKALDLIERVPESPGVKQMHARKALEKIRSEVG